MNNLYQNDSENTFKVFQLISYGENGRGVGKCQFEILPNINYLYHVNTDAFRLKYLIINHLSNDEMTNLDFTFEMYYYDNSNNKITLYNINMSDITENNIETEIKDNYIEYIIKIEDIFGKYINNAFLRGYFGINYYTINVILHTKNKINICKIGLKTLYYKNEQRHILQNATTSPFIESKLFIEFTDDIINKNYIINKNIVILPLQINQENELEKLTDIYHYNGFTILNISFRKSFIDSCKKLTFNFYVIRNNICVVKIPIAVIPNKNIQITDTGEIIITLPYSISKYDYIIYLNSYDKFKFLLETSNNIQDINIKLEMIEMIEIKYFIDQEINNPSLSPFVSINFNYYKNINEINNFTYDNSNNTYSSNIKEINCGFTFGIFVEIENYRNVFNELNMKTNNMELFIIDRQTCKIFAKHISENVFYYPFDLESDIDNHNNLLYSEGFLKIINFDLSFIIKLKNNYIPKHPIKIYLLSYRHNNHIHVNNIDGYDKEDYKNIKRNYDKTNQYKILEYFREKNMLYDDILKLITQFL